MNPPSIAMPITMAAVTSTVSAILPLEGSICTPEERLLPETSLHCLTRGESIGLTFVFVSGLLSAIAILYVFARVLINYIRNASKSGRPLVNVPMDVFMLSLFSSNLVASMAALLNGKWLIEGKVYPGPVCSTQGMLIEMGAMALALNTTFIAVHTFITLFWLRAIHSLLFPRLVIVFVWLLTTALTLAISVINRHVEPAFYAPNPYWCFIRSPFITFQLAGVYVWLWTALVVVFLTYIPLFFTLRKQNVDVDRRRIARVMLIYPLVFSVLVIPLTMVQWLQFGRKPSQGPPRVPSAATLTAGAIFHLCGLFEVIVFFQTRRGLLLFDWRGTHEVI